jgi:translation initiation factor eIF-2B subunit beta
VIIRTNAVLADGGLLATNGAHALCLAARHHSVPVIVLAPLFKLTPSYLCSYDGDSFNSVLQPSEILPFSQSTPVLFFVLRTAC